MSSFKSGQVWSLKGTRKFQVVISRVDRLNGNVVVHLSVLKDGGSYIDHMPFSFGAFKKSVSKLIFSYKFVSRYCVGYKIWRQEYQNNNAGFYDITVQETLML